MAIYDEKRDWFIRGCIAIIIGAMVGVLIFKLGMMSGRESTVSVAENIHESSDNAEMNTRNTNPNLPRIIYQEAKT